jgi:hypothetical protein
MRYRVLPIAVVRVSGPIAVALDLGVECKSAGGIERSQQLRD